MFSEGRAASIWFPSLLNISATYKFCCFVAVLVLPSVPFVDGVMVDTIINSVNVPCFPGFGYSLVVLLPALGGSLSLRESFGCEAGRSAERLN